MQQKNGDSIQLTFVGDLLFKLYVRCSRGAINPRVEGARNNGRDRCTGMSKDVINVHLVGGDPLSFPTI